METNQDFFQPALRQPAVYLRLAKEIRAVHGHSWLILKFSLPWWLSITPVRPLLVDGEKRGILTGICIRNVAGNARGVTRFWEFHQQLGGMFRNWKSAANIGTSQACFMRFHGALNLLFVSAYWFFRNPTCWSTFSWLASSRTWNPRERPDSAHQIILVTGNDL